VDFDVMKGGGKIEGQWALFWLYPIVWIARYMLV
jgi:hypothetical protein